jgi:hypothetical protein
VLADVPLDRGQDLGVALEQRSQCAAGPDGGDLTGIADEDEFAWDRSTWAMTRWRS